jgi:D-glycero-D-manno-heptose 1,7-bisphosphate phosphatase
MGDFMKLLILDKDGTLTRPVSGSTFVQHPEDQKLLPGVAETIARYRDEGWTMAIASNQGGVAAGLKTIEEAKCEMMYCMKLLPDIELGLFCPDNGETIYHGGRYHSVIYPAKELSIYEIDGLSNCRKPNPGMIEFAKYYFGCGAYAFPAEKYGRDVVITECLFEAIAPKTKVQQRRRV